MNSYYLKVMKASDEIVLKQFYKWKDTVEKFPDDTRFKRDYMFVLSVLLDRGYSEKELIKGGIKWKQS